jgi:hypothetical protein
MIPSIRRPSFGLLACVAVFVPVFAAACSVPPAEGDDGDDGSGSSSNEKPQGGSGPSTATSSAPSNSPSGGGDAGTTATPAADAGASVQPGNNCPAITGRWEGTATGTYIDILNPNNPPLPVDGTVSLKFTQGSGGNSTIDNGGEMAITLRKMPPFGNDVPVKQALTGKVECGVMKAEAKGALIIGEVEGTAVCTFKGNECAGEWNANSGGKPVAKGTFVLKPRS